MSPSSQALPKVVSEAEWRQAREALLAKEKALTRAKDALAAERRRQPMVKVEKRYVFEGLEGQPTLLDLFQGRTQLLLYHFMFAPTVPGWPSTGCPGCSMGLDNIGRFAPAHLEARSVSLAVVSRAPLANIEAFRKRMSWPHLWVSSANNTFNADFGVTRADDELSGLSVFLRNGSDVFRTYFTTQRGSEELGNVWGLLDVTPYGRQETWEDSPAGWPQTMPYQWWRLHDEYEAGESPLAGR
jgi:predicted dithiol-disulfide oxidoreductase (DUF899 family)